ncbi:oligosaccharide flippase family protein [Thermotoga petrophila]|uniref:oligosaccharide flippase family protein n=1 Tax=Thermotoga petrophila TaxID=93929 RepID=UPI0003063363|nr:oligosaccharide flippase family protein [Thermotoga petrophila]
MASIAWILLMPSEKFLGRVYGDVLTKTAISVVLFLIIVIRGKRLICVETWKYSLRIGLPVILHNLAGVILVQFDRFVIQDMIGPRAVGLYSYAYNLAMAPLIILGATNLAWVPWFYDKMALNEKEDIRNKSKIYNELFLLSLIVIYITIPWLGLIMAPKTYYQSLNILPIVIASYYMQFLYTLYVNFAFYFKRTLSVAVGTVLSGVINIVLNILLVPIFGYEVAALTTLISYFLLLTFHYINVRFFLKDETLSARYVFNWAFVIISISIFHYLISINFGMFSLQEILARIILFGIVGLYVIIKIYERFVSI